MDKDWSNGFNKNLDLWMSSYHFIFNDEQTMVVFKKISLKLKFYNFWLFCIYNINFTKILKHIKCQTRNPRLRNKKRLCKDLIFIKDALWSKFFENSVWNLSLESSMSIVLVDLQKSNHFVTINLVLEQNSNL